MVVHITINYVLKDRQKSYTIYWNKFCELHSNNTKQIHSITDIQAYLSDHTQVVLFWMCFYTSQRNRKNICKLFLNGLFDTAETNLETNYCTSLTNYAKGHFCQLLIATARATTLFLCSTEPRVFFKYSCMMKC